MVWIEQLSLTMERCACCKALIAPRVMMTEKVKTGPKDKVLGAMIYYRAVAEGGMDGEDEFGWDCCGRCRMALVATPPVHAPVIKWGAKQGN